MSWQGFTGISTKCFGRLVRICEILHTFAYSLTISLAVSLGPSHHSGFAPWGACEQLPSYAGRFKVLTTAGFTQGRYRCALII